MAAAACRHREFRKNVSNSALNKNSCAKFMVRCIVAMRRLPRHQKSKPEVKLIRVMSSNECL